MKKFIFVFFLTLFLAGCATFNPSKEVFKEKANTNSRTYGISINACFDVLKQVIL
ncbi:MAG: lipoprotein, partial [Candidatus Omnitrophica bacterium]|nr:lipoprotein [Candidatus Omnitrophota bacterium]